MGEFAKFKIAFFFLTLLVGGGCHPEAPILSTITVDLESMSVPVNKDLYGITVEEINHAVDGGLYAELIRNRSFEEGVPPLNCPYDAARNLLITPNGWSIPFLRPDSVPGWRKMASNTYMGLDTRELINDKNKRSLFVSVSALPGTDRGGVIAEGYGGFSLRKGEKYHLSLFAKGASMIPKTLRIALEDSLARTVVSDVFILSPVYDWRKYKHTFTAQEDVDHAVLTITADSTVLFWLDVVSLFPENTWKSRPNGQRSDLMELLAGLHPRFVRFPGGSFIEGYTAGTYPVWHETIGNIAERKHFWNVWGYGSTSGMGYHEYLQMCEDLGAEPVYVLNSGVTSQSRRPRYEDITAMDKLVQDALDALAYANAPTDSVLGALRARHGHPEPFHLKYVEIGSENYGQEYAKRFALFRKAIKDAYPDVMVISSSFISKKNREDWVDAHFYADDPFLIGSHNRFEVNRNTRRSPGVFIGEFSSAGTAGQSTLQSAIAEACFLIGVESVPDVVKRLAYAPVLGNVQYPMARTPLIRFDRRQAVTIPSYHLFKMFAEHRGDEVLRTEVQTYQKPQVTFGHAAIEMFDNSYEIKDARLNGELITEGKIQRGGWQIQDGSLVPEANRWNYLLLGDSSRYNYEYEVTVRRTKGSGPIQLRIRDNGKESQYSNYIGLTIGTEKSELYHQAGIVKDTLAVSNALSFESNRWYRVKMVGKNDTVRCYVEDALQYEAVLPSLPSLVSVATWDKQNNVVLLKVVNTTHHEEKTELNIQGAGIKNTAHLWQLTGQPDAFNSFENPDKVVPEEKTISFSLGGPLVYTFPPHSITILKLQID